MFYIFKVPAQVYVSGRFHEIEFAAFENSSFNARNDVFTLMGFSDRGGALSMQFHASCTVSEQ